MSVLFFVLLGFTLALAWFVLINGAAALVVAGVARRVAHNQPARPAAFWLALRLLPSVVSTVLVAAVFVPSYWLHEPRNYSEGFQGVLATLALLAFAVVVAAIVRATVACRRAARRAGTWMRAARPMALSGAPMPAFRIDVDAPVMVLVGIFKPKLFISRRVIASLSEEELAASVAHEDGHRRAFDNLKRLALCAAPDFLATTPVARNLERRWASAAERAADRRAWVATDGDAAARRCALASAIVKVARLTPPAGPITEPISTLVDGSDIESRVHSLLDADGAMECPSARPRRIASAIAAAIATIVFAARGYAPLLRAAHDLSELLVRSLP
jgi:beta-lactamase regulating signal transducer with metallopeptidase domain